MRIPVERPKKYNIFDDTDHYSYFETAEFQKYRKLVVSIVCKSHKPMTIGDIKKELGSSLIDHWLMDALEQSIDTIEKMNRIPFDLYFKRVRELRPIQDRDRDMLLRHLFPRREHLSK